jgi:PAS domain S-box-containing protein
VQTPPTPIDEAQRLQSLRALSILDTLPEERFDKITRLACRTFDVPIALVSLVDGARQWFKSKQGTDANETGREISFCAHAIAEEGPLVVSDTHLDSRFADNPLVTGAPNIRFYAGQPVHGLDGSRVGTICLIDQRPRRLTHADLTLLADFAAMIDREFAQLGVALSASIVEHSDDAIISTTVDGMIITWNAGAEHMFGYGAAEMMGHPITRILPADRQHEEKYLIAQLRLGQKISHFETRRVRSDGASLDVSVTLSPVRDASGRIIAVSQIARDITERQQQRELRDKNQQLERSNRDLEDFAYIASHDLKAPLSGIHTAALWLEEDLHDSLSDESRRLLALMRSRINRMETLLDDLLAYSRVGRTDTAVGETDLAQIFSAIIEVLNPPAHIQVRTEGELPVIVTASAQLEQVLRNLIDNAIKHHDKPRGEVVLFARRAGEFVEFAVRDDGPGILPQFHEKIFQLFQTLKRRDEVEGTGMGLAIVKKLVERQNCRITVHSRGNGTGTEFRFQWPVSPASIYSAKLSNA